VVDILPPCCWPRPKPVFIWNCTHFLLQLCIMAEWHDQILHGPRSRPRVKSELPKLAARSCRQRIPSRCIMSRSRSFSSLAPGWRTHRIQASTRRVWFKAGSVCLLLSTSARPYSASRSGSSASVWPSGTERRLLRQVVRWRKACMQATNRSGPLQERWRW